ncbi:hypothetical protein [Candidatus Burkholderia verschuerenii]|uniref:hypothetical protein n=1 Tax=Candidatus Burkholderia verschuerenii TaxID=242163 RepID=UPI000AD4743B|nr:hypothetical protein [Candidatus Burkholderia verschuerenii]
MNATEINDLETVILAPFAVNVALAGAVPRTLSGSEAGRVIGWGCRTCVAEGAEQED